MTDPEVTTGVLGTLGINAPLFAAQLFNFSIVVFVMWKWVFKPLLHVMETRAKEIADGLHNAKLADQRLSDASTEKERLLREARKESQKVIDASKEKAEAVRKQKLDETKAEIIKIAEETKSQIQSERDASYAALQREVADLVMSATSKVVAGLDETAQRKLITQAIKDIQTS